MCDSLPVSHSHILICCCMIKKIKKKVKITSVTLSSCAVLIVPVKVNFFLFFFFFLKMMFYSFKFRYFWSFEWDLILFPPWTASNYSLPWPVFFTKWQFSLKPIKTLNIIKRSEICVKAFHGLITKNDHFACFCFRWDHFFPDWMLDKRFWVSFPGSNVFWPEPPTWCHDMQPCALSK